MRKWLKRVAAKFVRKRPATKQLRSASVKIPHAEDVHIPLLLDPRLLRAAKKCGVMIKKTGTIRRETRVLHRSNGTDLEVRFFDGDSPKEHRTFEYDISGKLTRAMVTVAGDELTTYIFLPTRNGLELHHVEKL